MQNKMEEQNAEKPFIDKVCGKNTGHKAFQEMMAFFRRVKELSL